MKVCFEYLDTTLRFLILLLGSTCSQESNRDLSNGSDGQKYNIGLHASPTGQKLSVRKVPPNMLFPFHEERFETLKIQIVSWFVYQVSSITN